MKKTAAPLLPSLALLALLAIGSAAADAQAQSQLAIYGIIDAGLVHERGGSAGAMSKLTSGAASASRIGFRGAEDLGNGLTAFFTLETGTKIDTGEVDAAGTIFNRQALVGLKGGFGTVALGRQSTPYHSALANVADPFGTSLAGTSKNLFPDWGANVRTSNTVTYASPRWHGVDGELAYSLGEQATASAGRQLGGAVGYTSGPLALRLAYNSRNADVAAGPGTAAVIRPLGRNTLLGANYDFGWFKLYAAYGADYGFNSAPLGNANNPYGGLKPTPSADGREFLLGCTAPAGAGTLMLSAMRKNDRTAFNQDASAWGIGYVYPLSKRTGLYAAYGHIRNRNGAGYTVANNTEAGSGNTGYNLGLRHTF